MRYIILLIAMTLLIFGTNNADVSKITPWLLGINFTIAIFSINFTFFGHQLSKYKLIYNKITKRQWFNVVLLLSLPLIPLICFLIAPEYFARSALWILPILLFSSIDNAILTTSYLSAEKFIDNAVSDSSISRYLEKLSKEIKLDAEKHQLYLDDKNKYQLPIHAYNFEPDILGGELADIWDSMTIITTLSIENNDYPVFRQSLSAILKLVVKFYSFKSKEVDSYKIDEGIRYIAQKRLRSIITSVAEKDKGGIFFQSLSSDLCVFLMKDEILYKPCSGLARLISCDAVWVAKKMLESHSVIEPMKILNTIHRIAEINIFKMNSEQIKNDIENLDNYNISVYAYDIKELAVSALNNGNFHFAYRCMESLSYLGCNSAKLKSLKTVVAVFESIVHLGRLSRSLNIGCFWPRCLIPAESHAEEFMGHILTWLVHDMKSNGDFYMKNYAEQAYSRIRGVKCVIKPKPNSNPFLWIEELKGEDGEKTPHIEYESGMYGYGGKSDYSDFSNLKEYVLYGISSENSAMIFHSAPIPMNLSSE
ncbi:hypothetical protein [Pectobacterium carotovorum]|uniref:hypothetical protein n=2 Tax=Pectobacterium carotovorum TaxID=554 RepID=UPI000B0A5C26|nr:hypothetical protein [Pectobacterium carotovorum]MBA0194302.1 hypothetical protein [Pectobacterium carotovorum]UFT94025.1 hypothetical protein LQF52_19795 [Pectobacterium carotovorum]